MQKLLIFVVIFCGCTLFAQEEITIKATGEFAKELKELMEKYQTSEINGSIEIIDENAAAPEQSTVSKDEELEKSGEIVVVDVNESIYDKSIKEEKKGFSIVDMLFGETKIEGNLTQGESLYKKSCANCHGERAEKSSYLSARDLIKLPKEEIVSQIKSYRRDSGYGGSAGLIMRVQATMLNDSQIYDIVSYIESLK
ncbi:MAG: c-type cytochrome [Campylobacteraceae bacterium]|jgi:cytochrome c553|nr:c-type cytochrome [Campylobacteraceae bacterium]